MAKFNLLIAWGEYGLGASTNLSHAIHAYLNDSETITWHGAV
jgi:hypothetical protein